LPDGIVQHRGQPVTFPLFREQQLLGQRGQRRCRIFRSVVFGS
jgi:hypothetical protein